MVQACKMHRGCFEILGLWGWGNVKLERVNHRLNLSV